MTKTQLHQPRFSTRSVKWLPLVGLLAVAVACAAPTAVRPTAAVQPTAAPTATATVTPLPSATALPTSTSTSTAVPTPVPSPSTGFTATALAPAASCSQPSPLISALLEQTSAEDWLGWVKKLSGTEPVTVGGQPVTFTSRYTPAMFGSSAPNAFDFVLETVQGWYPAEQIQVQDFIATGNTQRMVSGKNLILTLPGENPAEVVILSAHLDSISRENPEQTAPGAEDNASGSAALLEAARLFRGQRFQRTLRIIWFTGEEEGLLGSKAYVNELKNPREIQGVINLDMFGYDSDNDGCFELHVGTLPASDRVGQCLLGSFSAYNPDVSNLPQPDYLLEAATGSSDHGSFWAEDIGAVELLENHFEPSGSAGCPGRDNNPDYHTPHDTYDRLNPASAIRVVRAALAAAVAMAGPLP
jgi:hypothetical protein